MNAPTLTDVLQARRRIAPYLARTPLHRYAGLDALIGTAVYVKHENHHPVCAFKVRGGINLIAQLSPEERARGVVTASTGNHGQSIAFASRLFGVTARVCVPEGSNPGKLAAMRGLGAELIVAGQKFDDARRNADRIGREQGFRYIHSGNEPHLIAGVGTEALEMLEDEPALDVIIVPVGGGSGAAGTCIAAKAINPRIEVIAVQASAARAAYESWKQRRPIVMPNETFAEGLATGEPFELPQAILREMLDDFVLVDDAALLQAMVWYAEHAHTLAEAAGASPLAAAWQLRERLAGKKVGLVLSGGNTSLAHLRRALSEVA